MDSAVKIPGLTRKAPHMHVFAVFQPIFTAQNVIAGFETLARTQDQTGNLVLPRDFDVISSKPSFDLHMLELASAFAAAARAARPDKKCFVSVNLMPGTLAVSGLSDVIGKRLKYHGVCPGDIGIEIHESPFAPSDTRVIYRNLRELQDQGHPVLCDDFGKEASNADRLREMKRRGIILDGIKIDESYNRLPLPRKASFLGAITHVIDREPVKLILEGPPSEDGNHAFTHYQNYARSAPLPVVAALTALNPG